MLKTQMKMPRGYGRLWSAATVSALGDGLRITAIPLLAAAITQDPTAIAVVSAAGFLPWPIFGLLGGAISDRFDRRRSMWIVNTLRAILVASATVGLLLLGSLPIALLAGLAFLLGTAETVYDNAAVGYLQQLLPKDSLATGNSRLFTAQLSATQLIGPPLGGILFFFGSSIPLALNALSFALSATLIASLPRLANFSPPSAKNLRKEVSEGIAWLWNNSTLRAMAIVTLALGAVSGALLSMLVVYVDRQLNMGSIGYGFLLGAFAVGSIAGSLWTPHLMNSRPLRQVLIGCILVTAVVFAGLAATSVPAIAAILLACLGIAVSVWNISSVTTRQSIVPNELVGRVSSAYRAGALTFTTIGALTAGILTSATTVAITMGACSGLTLLGLFWSIRGLRHASLEK